FPPHGRVAPATWVEFDPRPVAKYGPRPGPSSVTARAKFTDRHSEPGRGRRLDGSEARLAPRRHLVAPRREVRAQDELALETAHFETVVCVGDLIEGKSARRRAAGWRELPTGRRAAPGPPGTRQDVAPASRRSSRSGRAIH